jgi:hypothetical protein
MSSYPTSYDVIRDEVRDHWTSGRDGDLMVVFLDLDGLPLLTIDVDEGTHSVDELFLRHVTALVLDVRLPGVVLAVPRTAGRPTRVDRLLWHEMVARLSDGPTTLVDLLVVGEQRWWSAAGVRPRRGPDQLPQAA